MTATTSEDGVMPVYVEERLFGMSLAEGYWEPVTASIDWCERNYEVTYYVAEFWNCLSSLAISFVAFIGLLIALHYRFEKRHVIMNVLVVVIGVGSALYHGTLLYGMQMWDEIPMVWAMLAFHYFLYEYNATPKSGSALTRGLVILYALVVAAVHYHGGFTFAFQAHFIFLILSAIVRAYWMLQEHQEMEFNYYLGLYVAIFALACACWLIDNFLCSWITSSWPVNPQLHAFWHIFNAFNTHFGVQYAIALRLSALKMSPTTIKILGLPYIVPSRPYRDPKLHNGKVKDFRTLI